MTMAINHVTKRAMIYKLQAMCASDRCAICGAKNVRMRKCDEHKEYQVRVWTESEYEKGNGCPHCSYGLIYKDRCVICLRSPIAL